MNNNLKVLDTSVPGVLESLRKGEWLIPQFQRDFVWTTDQISELVQSILASRPIGMVTLWEQRTETPMKLERLSILDANPSTGKTELVYFPAGATTSSKTYAVLDGKQRCTAIAMAFGGFRAKHGSYRYSGRYFLDVVTQDEAKRVKFIKDSVVRDQGLDVDATCIARGLLPLASNTDGEEVLKQWMRYMRLLSNKECYPDHQLPSSEEIARRTRTLESCFEGIVNTKLAVYIVPEIYGLTDICEIFETLNTTGTKVSTVDLIHSWIYAETHDDPKGPLLLRDWLKDLGQKDGAYGWATHDDRPELMTQLVTATYVASDNKPQPRRVGTRNNEVTSVKAGDMLAVPTEYWRFIESQSDLFATYLGDGQKVVAGGYFPWQACPYPASMGIYVALRWHTKFDFPNGASWSRDEADALFQAFFWRNALSRRYDQGFLSQIGTDIFKLKEILASRGEFKSSAEWAASASAILTDHFLKGFSITPSIEDLAEYALDGDIGGALWKALSLPMRASVENDLVSGVSLAFPNDHQVEMHHIYPKEWCRNNRKHAALASILDKDVGGRDYVNSLANLMPLGRTSNNSWRQKFPAQYFAEKHLSYNEMSKTFESIFIHEQMFALLKSGDDRILEFWKLRANLIAKDLSRRMEVRL
ncbi:MAG TPA: DUF262 domain-containing protein [Arenimonas sp.]|uniref:GmrSD restriction endonuclease domain-containing protein n=1 Tax=Arenimonas sp. TaxID=1872635 RepID=UPI002D81036F|nr:DUF262 domain-containing protein [Arenimonas sp.]HEU0154414.1 DUF262 domain-containing protein [Arenimonas sp.]